MNAIFSHFCGNFCWISACFVENGQTLKQPTEKSFQYFLMRPTYVLHDMWLYYLTQLYAHSRHINDRFWRNSKFWKINFCAYWVQLRVCKLRRQEIIMSCATHFDLVKKYSKLASLDYFEVWSYLWILQEIGNHSMCQAHSEKRTSKSQI